MDWDERQDSRAETLNPPSFEYRFRASGEPDDSTVKSYAYGYFPTTVIHNSGALLYLRDIKTSSPAYAIHDVVADYGPRTGGTTQPGTYTFNFDTTGGTTRMTAAREHIESYPIDAANPNPEEGSIGVRKDGSVEGVDVVAPALSFRVQFRHALGEVTLAFAKVLADACGKTNSEPWLGFAAGELLFLGASGQDGSETEAEITYHFAASANATGIEIGGIPGIAKKGWEYLWVKHQDDLADGSAAVTPLRVHIERVYESIDFAATFGWGS